jgi:hypothetical protein
MAIQKRRRAVVAEKHALEKEIQRLLARPPNPERARLVRSLQRRLQKLHD